MVAGATPAAPLGLSKIAHFLNLNRAVTASAHPRIAMSGRVRTTLADGRRVTGYRKTLARRAPRTALHLLPDWRLSFDPPDHGLLGAAVGVFGTTRNALGRVTIAGKRKDFVFEQLARLLIATWPRGLINPLAVVLQRDDEPGPTLSGPIRKGEKTAGAVTFDGHRALLVTGCAMTQIWPKPR